MYINIVKKLFNFIAKHKIIKILTYKYYINIIIVLCVKNLTYLLPILLLYCYCCLKFSYNFNKPRQYNM